MKVVIVGGVAGGATAAARLRRLDEKAEIVVLERSGFVSYANCGLPYYIGGVIEDQAELTLQTPESFYARFRVRIKVHHEVTAIDRTAKTVTVHNLETGETFAESYDKLLLAPGAQPTRPPLPGVELDRLFTLRTVEDTLRIRRFVEEQHPRSAVLAGGGFIGLELAENLRELGLDVTIVQRPKHLMNPFDPDMAALLHAEVRAHGVHLALGHTVEGFTGTEKGVQVLLKDEAPLQADMVVLAIGVGMALALAGVVMQAIVKNPLADPYVLGVSSGASLGATLAILVGVGSFLGSGYVGLVAFAGAFLVSMGVIALANIGGRATSVKLILAGTALSAICAAVSNFFLYVINTSSGALEAVVRWTMGSLAAASWDTNLWMLAVSVLGALFFWTQYRTLNLMLLGDEAAVTLGTDLHRWRIVYLLAASLLVGFAVYTAGIIGFVGLVIPHMVRILFGTDHKKLIPISALLGAIFLLWSDVLCRVVLPGKEIPIGVLTALVGAPVFIYLMARKKYGFGGGD